MNIQHNENIVCFDVDDTLVLWDYPASTSKSALLNLDCYGTGVWVLPHKRHIEAIKRHKTRGHFVIVWSAGGKDWAATVVEALGLKECVDMVMSKPKWYFDDLPATAWMDRIFLEEKDGNN